MNNKSNKIFSILKVLGFSEDFNLLKLAENFNEIVNTTDFYTIFHVGRHESNLPDSVINNLNEFNLYLAQSDFSQSNDGFISKMLESIVDVITL